MTLYDYTTGKNDVDESLLQTIYRKGSILKEIPEGVYFFRVLPFLLADLLFRHHCWWDTPKGYVSSTSEIHACGFHHSCWREIPMHASSIHAPHPMCSHQHACHGILMHVLRQSFWWDNHDPMWFPVLLVRDTRHIYEKVKEKNMHVFFIIDLGKIFWGDSFAFYF